MSKASSGSFSGSFLRSGSSDHLFRLVERELPTRHSHRASSLFSGGFEDIHLVIVCLYSFSSLAALVRHCNMGTASLIDSQSVKTRLFARPGFKMFIPRPRWNCLLLYTLPSGLERLGCSPSGRYVSGFCGTPITVEPNMAGSFLALPSLIPLILTKPMGLRYFLDHTEV